MKLESQQNPYSAPEVPIEAITLTPLTPMQRRVLEFYLKHREQQPSWRGMLWRWLRLWSVALLGYGMAIGGAYFLIPKVWPWDDALPHFVAIFLCALAMGGMFRDITYLRQTTHIWPVLQDILDWDKVAARLESG
ncbi:MAG: hypothetical protein K8T91_11865 [Planctomycetes bacterium]|nr:hypothetical protein [Planctomycetota bacterium]